MSYDTNKKLTSHTTNEKANKLPEHEENVSTTEVVLGFHGPVVVDERTSDKLCVICATV